MSNLQDLISCLKEIEIDLIDAEDLLSIIVDVEKELEPHKTEIEKHIDDLQRIFKSVCGIRKAVILERKAKRV